MTTVLLRAQLIAPDSSHWAKWIDAAVGRHPQRQAEALGLHDRLLERGRLPVLTFHHMEELLSIDSDELAFARATFLKDLPLIAWLQSPTEPAGVGSIPQVLAAETLAYLEGCRKTRELRARVRELVFATGPGVEALGPDARAWMALRPLLRSQESESELIAIVAPLRMFDVSRTIGELSKRRIRSPDLIRRSLDGVHAYVMGEALASTDGDRSRAEAIADAFMARVSPSAQSPTATVRDMLFATLMAQGVDESEIRDDCVLADLTRLATLRSHMKVIAPEIGRPFDELKQIPLGVLPSQMIRDALGEHRQIRTKRPGSDVNDGFLAVLSCYCEELFVDKRTAEDFRRARRKEPWMAEGVGHVIRSANFADLLGGSA